MKVFELILKTDECKKEWFLEVLQTQAKVVRREESLLEFEIIGEDHTFLSMLREALKDQPGVLFTAFRFPHPLLENPIFYLRTSGGTDPIDAIKQAVEAISEKCDDLTDIFRQNFSDSV